VKTGSCLCEAVRYELTGPLRAIVACHCTQCRKASGHYVAATQAEVADVAVQGDSLTWFRSSEAAERGFCSICGSNLFWRRPGSAYVSIFVGGIDGPTDLRMESQLYTESAGDYYTLPDLPTVAQSSLK